MVHLVQTIKLVLHFIRTLHINVEIWTTVTLVQMICAVHVEEVQREPITKEPSHSLETVFLDVLLHMMSK